MEKLTQLISQSGMKHCLSGRPGVVHSQCYVPNKLYFFSIRYIIQIPASNVPSVQIHVPIAKLCIFMSYTPKWLHPCCGSVDLFETPCISSVSLCCRHLNDCTHFEVLGTFLEILCRSCVSLTHRHLNGCTHIEVLWIFLRHCVETVYNDLICIQIAVSLLSFCGPFLIHCVKPVYHCVSSVMSIQHANWISIYIETCTLRK